MRKKRKAPNPFRDWNSELVKANKIATSLVEIGEKLLAKNSK